MLGDEVSKLICGRRQIFKPFAVVIPKRVAIDAYLLQCTQRAVVSRFANARATISYRYVIKLAVRISTNTNKRSSSFQLSFLASIADYYQSISPVRCFFLISAPVIFTAVFASMYDFVRPPSHPMICLFTNFLSLKLGNALVTV